MSGKLDTLARAVGQRSCRTHGRRRGALAAALAPVAAGLFLAQLRSAHAASGTWDAGGGATTTWSTNLNWTGDTVPTFGPGTTFDLSTLDIAVNSISTADFSAT